MDHRDIAPVPPPPPLRSYFSPQSNPRPRWKDRIGAIAVGSLRRKVVHPGPTRNGSKLQKPRARGREKAADQTKPRHIQQPSLEGKHQIAEYLAGKATELFESHASEEEHDRRMGRPRQGKEYAHENQLRPIELQDIGGRCKWCRDVDQMQGIAPTVPIAPAVPPVPRRSSKRAFPKAAGAQRPHISGRGRLDPRAAGRINDWARNQDAGTLIRENQIDATHEVVPDHPPPPPPKDRPPSPPAPPAPGHQERAKVNDFATRGAKQSFMDRSSFAHRLLPRKSMMLAFKKTLAEEGETNSDSSTVSIHPLVEDEDTESAGRTQIAPQREQHLNGEQKLQKGKQSFLQDSSLYRKLTAPKTPAQRRPRSQHSQVFHRLFSPSTQGEDVPAVPAIPEQYHAQQATAVGAPRHVASSPTRSLATPTLDKYRVKKQRPVSRTQDGDNVYYHKRLGNIRKAMPFRNKSPAESVVLVHKEIRETAEEDYEQEKVRLFVALNIAREMRDAQVAGQQIKRMMRGGHPVPENWQLPPASKLEKLKFDKNLDSEASRTADEQDERDRNQPRPSPAMSGCFPPEPTDIEQDEATGTVCMIGPPRLGANATGSYWSRGHSHLHSVSGYRQKTLSDDEEETYARNCPCKSNTAWKAITDESYRYVGLARTKEEQRWVVILARGEPIARRLLPIKQISSPALRRSTLASSSHDSGHVPSLVQDHDSLYDVSDDERMRPRPTRQNTTATMRSASVYSQYDELDVPLDEDIPAVPPLQYQKQKSSAEVDSTSLNNTDPPDDNQGWYDVFNLDSPDYPIEAGPTFLPFRGPKRTSSLSDIHVGGGEQDLSRQPTTRRIARKPVPSQLGL